LHNSRRLFFLATLSLLTVFIVACALPAPIAGLFATATATSTNTPTVTPSPTATPPSPVTIAPCQTSEWCPGAIAIYDLVNGSVDSGQTYTVEVPFDRSISFFAGWIAQDEATVIQNSQQMERFVEIDGQNYWNNGYLGGPQPYTYDNEPSKVYSSIWQGVSLSGWQVGVEHTVRIGFRIKELITDGTSTYPAGTVVDYTYVIKPVFIPTDTPTPEPTATFTPRPTNTYIPRPTSIPVTPTAACDATGTISIINDTGGQVTLYLTGPAKYTFYIPAGSKTLTVCPGTYSYTGYGCGGASKNGTVSTDTEEITFFCTTN